MEIVRSFVVEVPVRIEAADELSAQAAKKYLKSFFTRIEAGANHENLVFKVSVGASKLFPRDNEDD